MIPAVDSLRLAWYTLGFLGQPELLIRPCILKTNKSSHNFIGKASLKKVHTR